MKVLVTGGAGFIGSHLVEALVERGDEVRVLDNLSSGRRRNLADLPVAFIRGDIRDYETVRRAVDGCEWVFHQAALVSVPRSIEEPKLNHDVNVTGAFHLFEAARQAGVKRVVYASSAAVYGDTPSLPAREDDPPNPITPYAAAKLMNEQMAAAYNRSYGTQFVGLRYFNVFGPRQDPSSPYSGVLSIFCQAAITGQGVTIYGDGRQTRDFLFVSDVAAANLAAAVMQWREGAEVFNVGRGEATNLCEMARMMEDVAGRPLPITHAPPRPGDIRHSVAGVETAVRELGWRAAVPLADGLRRTMAWFAR